MFRTHAHRSMDMTEGPLFSKVFFFALPLMLSGILQLAFNAADTVVVGRFAGSQALAAVGSVGSLNNLIISLFIGLSVGANVLVARHTGARDARAVSETVHTSVLLSLVGGVLLAFSKRYDTIELLRAQQQAPTLTSPQHPKYCAYCGQLLEERARYCPNCGAPCSSDL